MRRRAEAHRSASDSSTAPPPARRAQALAYATLAGLPEQYGLYSAYAGPVVYALLGTSKDITVGPTAIMSIMVGELGSGDASGSLAADVVCIALLAGFIQALAGALRLGVVVSLVSQPVLHGFVVAATIEIGSSQLSKLLGYPSSVHVRRPFLQNIYDTASNLLATNGVALGMGAACLALIWGLKVAKRRAPRSRLAAGLGTARNVVVVALATGVCALCVLLGHDVLPRVGELPDGLPAPAAPALDWPSVRRLALPALSVAIIGFIEDIAIAKSFARRGKYMVDASQELLALGAANVLGSLFHAMPVTGSFSRTAVNNASGAASQLSGVFTALTVLGAIFLAQPVFAFIPKPALAAVIMSAVVSMVDPAELMAMWRSSRLEFTVVFIPTVVAAFVIGLEYAVFVGVACSLPLVLIRAASPVVERGEAVSRAGEEAGVAVVRLTGALAFPGVAKLEAALESVKARVIVLDVEAVTSSDFSSAVALSDGASALRARGGALYLAAARESVRRVVEGVTGCDVEDGVRFAFDMDEALSSAAADVAAAAQDCAPGVHTARRRSNAAAGETTPLLQRV